jgi:hypothetical protein
MARTKFSEFRKQVEARRGAAERLAAKRAETLELVAVFDEEDRRVPINLGKDTAA